MNVETHIAAWASGAAGLVAFGAVMRWLIVAALEPRLQAVHRRIDDHMTLEEREAAEQRVAQAELAASVNHATLRITRLDEVVTRVDERTARNEQQLAWILGKMEAQT